MSNPLGVIGLPQSFNYIAAFLSFSCQLRCPYCINHHGGDLVKKRRMSGSDWIAALDRLPLSLEGPPVTFQGGEPTIHPDFYEIACTRRFWGKMDLLTNFMLDEQEFMRRLPPEAFKRDAPYASIRVSWHVGQNNTEELLLKVAHLTKFDYHIGIWAVDHPDHHAQLLEDQKRAHSLGIDFRLKEFLGPHGGKEYGTMRYAGAVNGDSLRHCMCRTSELLIDPRGDLFRCHSDLYAGRCSIGHIMDQDTMGWGLGQWSPCSVFGRCNSCDIKVKTDRFQKYGHSSVEIKDVSAPYITHNPVLEVENTYGKIDAKPA